jgi:hypothetical protein
VTGYQLFPISGIRAPRTTSISLKAICCFAPQSQFFDLRMLQDCAAAKNAGDEAGFGNQKSSDSRDQPVRP